MKPTTASKNLQPVYFCFVSGVIHSFFASEEEAKAEVSDPSYGVEFNGQWIQAEYGCFPIGTLQLSDRDSVAGYRKQGRWIDVAHTNQIHWVQWGNLAIARPI